MRRSLPNTDTTLPESAPVVTVINQAMLPFHLLRSSTKMPIANASSLGHAILAQAFQFQDSSDIA